MIHSSTVQKLWKNGDADMDASSSIASGGNEPQLANGTWRLDIAPGLTWEDFLLEVQDVMGVPGISGESGCR